MKVITKAPFKVDIPTPPNLSDSFLYGIAHLDTNNVLVSSNPGNYFHSCREVMNREAVNRLVKVTGIPRKHYLIIRDSKRILDRLMHNIYVLEQLENLLGINSKIYRVKDRLIVVDLSKYWTSNFLLFHIVTLLFRDIPFLCLNSKVTLDDYLINKGCKYIVKRGHYVTLASTLYCYPRFNLKLFLQNSKYIFKVNPLSGLNDKHFKDNFNNHDYQTIYCNIVETIEYLGKIPTRAYSTICARNVPYNVGFRNFLSLFTRPTASIGIDWVVRYKEVEHKANEENK